MQTITKIEDAINLIKTTKLYTEEEMTDITDLLRNLNQKLPFTNFKNIINGFYLDLGNLTRYVICKKDNLILRTEGISETFNISEIKIINKIILDSKDVETLESNLRDYKTFSSFLIDCFNGSPKSFLDLGVATLDESQKLFLTNYNISLDHGKTSMN